MKLKYLALLVLVSAPLCGATRSNADVMIDAIKKIDRDKLNQLLIPGFFIREADKKRYLDAAKDATNITYKHLHSYSTRDFFRSIRAVSKLGLSGLGIAAGYAYYKQYWDISLWKVESHKTRKILGQDLTDNTHRLAVYGTIGFLATYLLRGAMSDFSDIVNKKEQWQLHREALANEAVILRIPVCGNGSTTVESG